MTDSPTFGGLHFWVADMNATLAFYRLVGVPISDEPWEGEFLNVQLAEGKSFAFGTYGLTQRYDPAFEPPATGRSHAALQFNLPSRAAVDEMHERLTAAGHPSHLTPIDAFWGNRYCEVVDPDGNVVGFHGSD
jgi:catechol 2,3-dioxygenase-like lactoylglutathione lyase family enzyme